MPIFQAIGLGILILVLKLMAPSILSEGEKTLLAFLHGAEVSATAATQLAASAGEIHISPTSSQLSLPQAPQIRSY